MCVRARENGHSPSNDESITGTDVTQHFPEFILQMADRPDSILEDVGFNEGESCTALIVFIVKQISYSEAMFQLLTFQLYLTVFSVLKQSLRVLFQQGESETLAPL